MNPRAINGAEGPQDRGSDTSVEPLPPGARQLDPSTVRLPGDVLARLLRDAGVVTIRVADEASGSDATLGLEIEVFGGTIRISVPSADLTVEDLTELTAQPTRARSRVATYRRLEDRSVETLARLGLPLYWNEDWLRAKYDECGTFAEIARRYPSEVLGVTFTAIANYARDNFHWSVRGELAKKRDTLLLEYENRAGNVAQTELADKYEINASTVNRWIAGAHDAYRAFARQRTTLEKSAKQRAAFAEAHSVPVALIDTWLEGGSPVFSVQRTPQRKKHYYSHEQYEALRARAREIHRDSNGRATKTKVARELGIDRSTLTGWFKEFDAET